MADAEEFWGEEEVAGREQAQGEEDDETGERPHPRRFSFGILGKRMALVAQGVGDSLARTAAAVGEVIVDSDLRSKSAALLAESVGKAAAGVGKGAAGSCHR